MEHLYGTGVALITPFKEDLSVDVVALQHIVEHAVNGGVDYLVVLGTTAETATLKDSEKEVVIKKVVETNAGRLPLVLGLGGNNTALVVEELRTRDLSDFVAILSVSPYYNRPTQEGIYQHFKAISSVSPVPIILYNVPGRTGSNMSASTTIRLAEDFNNVVAIKEACGDMNQIKEIIKGKPSDFLLISGDDITALPTILAGGVGIISVMAQGLPKEFSKMIKLARHKKIGEAYEMYNRLEEGMNLIFEEGNPAGIKCIFETLNIAKAVVRLPLLEASKTLKLKITHFVNSLSQVSA